MKITDVKRGDLVYDTKDGGYGIVMRADIHEETPLLDVFWGNGMRVSVLLRQGSLVEVLPMKERHSLAANFAEILKLQYED